MAPIDDPIQPAIRPTDREPRSGPPNKRSAPPTPSLVGGGNLGILVILALLVLGGGWYGYVQNEQLKLARAEREAADARLRLVEEELSLVDRKVEITDEERAKAGDSLTAQINLWESEVRKLWAIAQKSRPAIEQNTSAVAALAAEAKALSGSVATVKQSVTAQGETLAEHEALVAKVKKLEEQSVAILSAQRDLADRLNVVSRTLNSVKSDSTKRLVEVEQAMAGFDNYRVQVSRRLSALERALTRTGSASASGTATSPSPASP